MAKFIGNIFNRAAGSIGGQTFSQARHRGGKLQTARQRVAPSNPQTSAQQANRNRYRLVSEQMAMLNPLNYTAAFRGSRGRLPSFQALQSILLAACSPDAPYGEYRITPQRVFNDGVHMADSWSHSNDATTVTVTWSTENPGPIPEPTRAAVMYFTATGRPSNNPNAFAKIYTTNTRSTGGLTITPGVPPSVSGGFLLGLYFFESPLDQEPKPSSVEWKLRII